MNELENALQKIREGEYEEADKQLSDIIDREGFGNEALGHRAFMRLSLGRFEEARNDYENLLKIQEPTCNDPEYYLAKVTLRCGEPEKAIRLASELLKKDAQEVRATHLIVEAQKALGLNVNHTDLSRSQEPLAKPINSVLTVLEKDEASAFPASIHPEVSRLIYTLVRATKPKVAIETGTFIGYSAISIAQALEDIDCGHLHCFDIFVEWIKGYQSPIVGSPKEFKDVAAGHIEQSGLGHRITIHQGDSSTTIQKIFPEEKPQIDFAFIDGDHKIQGCLKDWQAIDSRLSEGAIIVFHDTNPEACHWLGPRFLMEKMGEEYSENYRWINIQTLEGIGLGVIQKNNHKDRFTWKPKLSEVIMDQIYTNLKWSKRSNNS